ncbi:MAG TPA: hypothetical protein VIK95_10990 [Egibacteraceae bacterium]
MDDPYAGPRPLRHSVAYGLVVTLFIAPFVVFAVGVGSGFAVSSRVVIPAVAVVTWAWCTWLLHSGRGTWLLATFLAAVAAVVVVLLV